MKPLTWLSLPVSQLQGSTITAIISAHMPALPGQHMWRVLAGPNLTSPKSENQMVVLRFTTLSVLDYQRRNPRKKNYREHSDIKCASVSALTCSVPCKMAKGQYRVSALIRN